VLGRVGPHQGLVLQEALIVSAEVELPQAARKQFLGSSQGLRFPYWVLEGLGVVFLVEDKRIQVHVVGEDYDSEIDGE
jgi:hypothetical protein